MLFSRGLPGAPEGILARISSPTATITAPVAGCDQALSVAGDSLSLGRSVVRPWPTWSSPGGGVWLRDANGTSASRPASTCRPPGPAGAGRLAVLPLPAGTGWIVNLGEARFPARQLRRLCLGVETLRHMADRAADLVGVLVGFVVLLTPVRRWMELGGARPAQDGRAARRGQLFCPDAGHRGPAEAQKFDAFNRMSAFVVHDLKNLVAQMSLMLRNAGATQGQSGVPGGHARHRPPRGNHECAA